MRMTLPTLRYLDKDSDEKGVGFAGKRVANITDYGKGFKTQEQHERYCKL